MPLKDDDYKSLEKCYVSQRYADAAEIRRVDSLEGRDRVGRNGAGDYAGTIYPYIDPVSRLVVGERLRLDHPPFDSKGKPKHKYLSPPGQRMHFYWPFADPGWFDDPAMPIVIVEGEKKYLAVHRAAHEVPGDKPLFFAIALAGVWAWLGKTGIATNEKGKRVDVKGVIPDFDRVVWKNRRVVILFDSNVLTNEQVSRARNQLARELASRGALVFIVDLPGDVGGQPINGVDDFLAAAGLDPFVELFQNALRWDWRTELHKTKDGKVRAGGIHNVLVALRYAPELHGALGYNQFSEQTEIRKRTPWQTTPGPWRDSDEVNFRDWLENRGIFAAAQTIGEAVAAYAAEHSFHPVRDYLESLRWDKTGRIDDWLTLYATVEPDDHDYVRAVGKRWLISAVARVFEPGCKVDHTLIFEGPQGAGKSRLIKILGGEFYSDDIPDLSTKDAAMSLKGVWIAELSELDAMTKADVTRIKSFISRTTDHYRPPYGRHFIDSPRQVVFAGSINSSSYLKDETGGRRFWPVFCGGELRLDKLEYNRDQLWAEAVVRYRAGDKWWLDDGALIKAANNEQDARFQSDPWEPLIDAWLLSRTETTTAEVIQFALQKPFGQWTRADEIRVGQILRRLGWETQRLGTHGPRRRIYRFVNVPNKKGEPTA